MLPDESETMKDAQIDAEALQKPLEFNADKGSSRSTWIAVLLLLLIVGWMGSGFVIPAAETAEENTTPPEPGAVAVAVQKSTAESVTQFFLAEGQALPDRNTAILSEMGGDIAEVLVKKGDVVTGGQVIARFDTTQREADLEQAREALASAQREFDNAETLLARGSATTDRVTQARTALAAAKAQFSAAEEDMKASEWQKMRGKWRFEKEATSKERRRDRILTSLSRRFLGSLTGRKRRK